MLHTVLACCIKGRKCVEGMQNFVLRKEFWPKKYEVTGD